METVRKYASAVMKKNVNTTKKRCVNYTYPKKNVEYRIMKQDYEKGGDNVAKKKDKDTHMCPDCKAYKELGMDACLGCCGRK